MRKLIVLSVLLMASLALAGVVAGDVVAAFPGDVEVITLHDNAASSSDTFTAGECQAYGPYDLTSASGQPAFKGFQLYGRAITGTTPTMSFGYQLIPTGLIKDTLAVWTEIDTLDATGMNGYVDLSSKAGRAIVFRVNNYDGTACQIPDYLKIMFKKNVSANYDVR